MGESRFRVALAGTGYATIFGFSFLATKGALDTLHPMELLFLRFLMAAVVLAVLRALGVLRLDFRHVHVGHLALTCLFQPILYFLSETYGVRASTSAMAGIFIGAIPATVAIAGTVMLGEPLGLARGGGVALSVAGVALAVLSGDGSDPGGTGAAGMLLLAGAVGAATMFNIFSRKTSRGLGPLETTYAMMWTGAVFFGACTAVLHLLGSGPAAPGLSARAALLVRAADSVPALLYLGLLSSVVAFFLINYTLSRVHASRSAVFTNLTTLVSVLAGVVVRGEPFTLRQTIGCMMILTGVWLANSGPGAGKIGASPGPEGRLRKAGYGTGRRVEG